VILALKGMESIWTEIKVVILTMRNPFGGSGIEMETTQVWFKMEYDTHPYIKNRLSQQIYTSKYCDPSVCMCASLKPIPKDFL